MTYDFSGYATKHNVRCSDGRTIMPEAFKDCDGQIVPLVWQHVHRAPDNVLGHAELEARPDGVYAYCSLNNTQSAKTAEELIKHGDICALSIYANHLQQVGQNVIHGVIREVSLVLAGANPEATIDNLAFAHSDGSTEISSDEACMYFVDGSEILYHADSDEEDDSREDDSREETIGDILDTLNDKQMEAVAVLIGMAKNGDLDDEDEKLSHADEQSDDKAAEEKSSGEDGLDVEKVLKTFSDDQLDAVKEILSAVSENRKASDSVAEVFDKFTDEQKDAVYILAGALMKDKEIKHADESDETIQDVIDTLSEEQKDALDVILSTIADGKGKVSQEVADTFNTFSDKQKNAVYALIGMALDVDGADTLADSQEKSDAGSDAEDQNEEIKHFDYEGDTMKRNVFDTEDQENVLTHSDMEVIFTDAPRLGSLKEAVLAHGITDIEVLFPEAQAVNNEPYQIVRRMEWVSTVLNGIHKSPFSRIKSTAANLSEEAARAKGYVKGRKKIQEQIAALRRVTTPQTVYKLQKLDRDDVIDITDFDVVAWMKQEMRLMLDEEIARAILVGDGRMATDPEKIFEDHIRSVWNDDEMYTIHQVIPAAKATDYTEMIDEVVRSRKGYRGSGNPVMFIGSDILTEMRLLKDNDNRFRYESDAKLAEALRVSKIEEVELFNDLVRTVEGKDRKLVAIILNLADYTVGANKGGEVNLFDDFDLDYNRLEYLIESRMSGALTMPKSAIAIEIQTTTDSTPEIVYAKVTSPVTADIADYYEQDEYGRYVKTIDTAVIAGKTYYEIAD